MDDTGLNNIKIVEIVLATELEYTSLKVRQTRIELRTIRKSNTLVNLEYSNPSLSSSCEVASDLKLTPSSILVGRPFCLHGLNSRVSRILLQPECSTLVQARLPE